MMKNYKTRYLFCVFTFLCFLGSSLCAQEVDQEERVQIGNRRELIAKENSLLKKEKKTNKQTKKGVAKKHKQAASKSIFCNKKFVHHWAWHAPDRVSLSGDFVTLEDGSIWKIRSQDCYKTLEWYTNDMVIITLNNNWFSKYLFKLINQTTRQEVEANLEAAPYSKSDYRHQLSAIDYDRNYVYLEDRSCFAVRDFVLGSSIFPKWVSGDTVIIGVNNDWLANYYPNILINVHTLTCTRACFVED